MQGLEIVSWLPPVIISAIVSFVALFIVRYNMQSDQGVKTQVSAERLAEDLRDIKVTTSGTDKIVGDIATTIRIHDYRITQLEDRVEREKWEKEGNKK